jgi:hypothetical protein
MYYSFDRLLSKNKIDTLPATIFRNLSGLEFLSWVILSNAFETEADEVVVYKIQKQTILEQSD